MPYLNTSGTTEPARPCSEIARASSQLVLTRAQSTCIELRPGITRTSWPDSSGSSFFVPLKKPESPDITTATRRCSGCSAMVAAILAGAISA